MFNFTLAACQWAGALKISPFVDILEGLLPVTRQGARER